MLAGYLANKIPNGADGNLSGNARNAINVNVIPTMNMGRLHMDEVTVGISAETMPELWYRFSFIGYSLPDSVGSSAGSSFLQKSLRSGAF